MQLRSLPPLLLATLLSTAACVESPDDTPDDVAAAAAALNGPLGQRLTGNPVTVPVCWSAPSATLQITMNDGSVVAESTLRGWAREAVEGQWSRVARVNFTGWGACTPSSTGIRLVLAELTRPDVSAGWDAGLAQLTGEIFLLRDGISTLCRADSATFQRCVRSLAVHTFGHVLGFNHQENRPDYIQTIPGPDCRQLAVGSGQLLGGLDLGSTMSTCGQPSTTPATFKTALSPGDIASVQVAYGRRLPGQLANPRGGDMLAANLGPDPRAFLWDADEAAGQLWTYDWARQTFGVTIGARTGCLDTFPSAAVGRELFAGTCFFDSFQVFRWNDVNLRGFGGLCLETPGTFASGTQLRIGACVDDGRQRWAIDTLRRIRLIGTSQCVTADPTAAGAAITLQPCGAPPAGAAQSFSFVSDGTLRFGADRCVDSVGPATSDFLRGLGLPIAGRVFTYPCGFDHELTQRWNLSGRLQHSSGLCVDHANATANGTTVPLAACNNSDSQRWDFYWR